jgi:hypothetical protein
VTVRPQAAEDEGGESVGEDRYRELPVRPVPLDERIHGAENQSARKMGIDIGADSSFLRREFDQFGDTVVELASSLQDSLFSGTVPMDSQQQGDIRQLGCEYFDAPTHDVLKPGRRGELGCIGFVDERKKGIERTGDGKIQKFLLAGDMVVDAGLAEAQASGQLLHTGGVITALVEDLDRDLEKRITVVVGPASAILIL